MMGDKQGLAVYRILPGLPAAYLFFLFFEKLEPFSILGNKVKG